MYLREVDYPLLPAYMATSQYSTSIDSGISKDANHPIAQNQVLPAPSATSKPLKRVSPGVLADVAGNHHNGSLETAGPGVVANTPLAGDRNEVMPTLDQAELTPPPYPEYGGYAPPTSAGGHVATSSADMSGGLSHTPSTQQPPMKLSQMPFSLSEQSLLLPRKK